MPGAAAKKANKTGRLGTTLPSERLRAPEAIAADLDAWLEEAPDDAAGIVRALGNTAPARGTRQVANDAGLGRESR
jgi:DNA-binding phage protein